MKAKVNPFYRSIILSVGDEFVEIFFDNLNEWSRVDLRGNVYDVCFDYHARDNFRNEKDWLNNMVSAYLVEEQDLPFYENNVITEVKLEL
jgi:hypothetical protein